MGLLRSLLEFILISVIFTLLLLYSPLFLECDPIPISVKLAKRLEGPLAPNEKLNKAEKLFEGQVNWPESLAVIDGAIYTGVNDGSILKIVGDTVTPLLKTGESCEGQWEEPKCGRPLGMRAHKDGYLYVVDAFYGLYKVDVKKGTKELLLSPSTTVGGKKLFLMNDMVFGNDGLIYFTQSTTRWNLTHVVYMLLEHDNSGRMMSFDPKSKEVRVLAENLQFPNGIELSADGKNLIFAECSGLRILQYHLEGAKKGQVTVLADGLPGEPDNIRSSPRGGYWVAINSARSAEKPTLLDHLGPYPKVRKAAMRLLHALGSLLTKIASYIPDPTLKGLAFNALSARFIVDLIPSHGMILRMDDSGKIIESLQSPDGQISHLSQVLEHEGHLYLGSWRNKYLARVKL